MPMGLTLDQAKEWRREREITELQAKMDLILARLDDSKDSRRSQTRRRRERDKDSSDDDYPKPRRRDKPKIDDIPEFYGSSDPEEFLDWVQRAEKVFDYKEYDEKKAFKVAELKLTSYASFWLDNMQRRRHKEDRGKINTWSKLKKYMEKRFVPDNYEQIKDLKDYIHKLEREKMIRDLEKEKQREIERNMAKRVTFQEIQKSCSMNVLEEEELYEEKKIQHQEKEHASEVEPETHGQNLEPETHVPSLVLIEDSQREQEKAIALKPSVSTKPIKGMDNSKGVFLIEEKEIEREVVTNETNFSMVTKEVEEKESLANLESIMGEFNIIFLQDLRGDLLQIYGDEQSIDFIAVSQKEWDDPNVKAKVKTMQNFYVQDHVRIEEVGDDYKIEFSKDFRVGATFEMGDLSHYIPHEKLQNLRSNSFEEEEDDTNIDMKKRRMNKIGIGDTNIDMKKRKMNKRGIG